MTRFARAKGSKASNEKAPEDATPWEVMKEQLLNAKKENEDAKNRQAAEQQRIENYEKFLKDRRVQKKPATWCDFPELEQPTRNEDFQNQPFKKKNKKNKEVSKKPTNGVVQTDIGPHSEISKTKNKKKKNKNLNSFQTTVSGPGSCGVQEASGNLIKNKKRRHGEDKTQYTEPADKLEPPKKKKKQKIQVEINQLQNTDREETKSLKKKKHKKKDVAQLADYPNTKSQEDNQWNSATEEQFESHTNKNLINKHNKEKSKKKRKLVGGQPVRRKEINDKSFQLIIGGKDVELVRYDGFPIMKRDAERLAELKDSMINKGIPKSEVQRTMKLERRRAEKALARLKRDVCYNCRKGGHNLSDCPELKSKIPGADAAEGVCFKCGSTEHRQFECKVQRDKEFRFATCFICKEPGHIARQCPDNPKGLYPNGGSCKLCGDVTHLRKDCPTASDKKEETAVKLQTLDSTDDIEGIGVQNKSISSGNKKPKKIRF